MNIDLKSPESNESLMIISCETDPRQAGARLGARRLRLCHGRGEAAAAGGQFLLRDHLEHLELTQEDVRCQGADTGTGEHLEEFDIK